MTTRVQKWGNSLAVRLPKELIEKVHLKEGGDVSIESKNGVLLLKPVSQSETLESLVKKISSSNRHKEIDWGGPRGREAW